MRYGNRSIWQRIIRSPLLNILLAVFVVVLVKATWSIHAKALESSVKLKEAQAQYHKLEDHQADLSNQINYLSTDAGVEAELRTKYRAVKEGESVAVIVDPDSATADSGNAIASSTPSFWSRIWSVFGI